MFIGPLNAVINAQARAALQTVNYITTVGFTGEGTSRSANMVDFNFDTVNATTGLVTPNKVTVPLLTLVPIPYLKIQSCSIEFNAKISSVSKSTITTDTSISAEASGQYGAVDISASFSTKIGTEHSNEVQREYSMTVRVEAVQDEPPLGLVRLMSILDEAIIRGR
jgi:Protein of unknown function (DUF2589)